jgi:hypothetical protein
MSVVGATDVKQTPAQEDTVRGLVRLVSDVIYQITEGRARIGSLDYVDDIKDTDLIISMTGNPSSPGWSTMKGSDGQPGQMVLYYQSLATTTQQDIVFTATHETCHYLFGLADEYNYGNFPNGCPPRPGPGCLMDNYRPGMRGFMGKLCDGEHNSQNTQRKSCKALVDDYFSAHGVTETDKDPNVTPFVPDPRPTVISAAINQTRAVAATKAQSRRSGSLGSSVAAGLKSIAGKTLKTLIDEYNRNNSHKLIFTAQQLKVATDLISKAGALLPTERPAGLSPENYASLKAEAQRLGNSPEIKGKKTDTSRFTAIRNGLRAYMRQLIKTDGGAAGVDATEQTALIERLARDEARSPADKRLDRLVAVTDIQAELSLVAAENIIRVLDEMDAPGIPRQLEILGGFRKRFDELSIPGRTSAGFGLRRTRFITPFPSPEYEIVLTQAGVVSYPSISARGFQDFSRLIDRARIELVTPTFSADAMPLDPRIDRPYEAIPVADLQALRQRSNINLQSLLNDLLNQLQRNRLENIGVLVPPGGLPPELSGMLQVFQTKLRDDFDVRLDVATVGVGQVPDTLRHLSVVSHGSMLTVTDLDEVGAIAQRLKNEQTSGSWVTVPQPSTLPQRDLPRLPGQVVFSTYRAALKSDPEQAAFFKGLLGAGSVDERLQNFLTSGSHIPDPVRQKVDAARTSIRILDQSLKDLQVIAFGTATDDYHGQPLGAALGDDSDVSRRRVTNLFLRKIYEAKVQITDLKKVMDEVRSAQASLAAGLDATVKQAVEVFGPDLARLDALIRRYERLLEAAVEASRGQVYIYQRVDRVALDRMRVALEQSDMVQGTRPNAARINTNDRTLSRIDLSRFYAEKIVNRQEDADLELVVGLSRPLPRLWDEQQQKAVSAPSPTLELYSGPGLARTLKVDPARSSPTLLVYRVDTAFPLPEGWYDPMLNVDTRVLRRLSWVKPMGGKPVTADKDVDNPAAAPADPTDWDEINFTFSVGSNRRNVQLITGLVQAPGTLTRGTLSQAEGYATVQVQVSAGSSVLDARVRGFYQMITTKSTGPIAIKAVEFADNGQDGDTTADDGIYTGKIDIHEVNEETEFRVFVLADTTNGKAHYIALDNPNRDDQVPDPVDLAALPTPKRPKDKEAAAREAFDQRKIQSDRDTKLAEGPAIKFQRATTVHFRVKP